MDHLLSMEKEAGEIRRTKKKTVVQEGKGVEKEKWKTEILFSFERLGDELSAGSVL